MWWLLCSLALAESASTLGEGAAVAYAGLGTSSFRYGASGLLRDRQWRARADLYGAWGLGRGLQVSLDVPLMRTWVADDPQEGPCPNARFGEGYCATLTTVGEGGLHARWQVLGGQGLSGPVQLTLGLGVRTDAWNEDSRGQWNNAGLGVTSGVGSVLVGGGLPAGLSWVAAGHYRAVAGRELRGERLPADAVAGGAELAWRRERLTLTGGAWGFTRLGGVPYGEQWIEDYLPTEDRWAALLYRELKVEGKLSWALREDLGVHLSGSKVLVAASGPKDTVDVALGVHRYWSGG